MRDQEKLRTGFSTGACAAAAIKAAFLSLSGELASHVISILFPDGKYREMLLHSVGVEETVANISIIKDAGDDPDVTDKAEIRVKFGECKPAETGSEDFVLRTGRSAIILRGGRGVGFVTRKGLEVPPGKWAINPVPRQMIIDNLEDAGIGSSKSCWLAEISVFNGEKLAERTLNPLLGIRGGLSILGTTGLVVPHSNQAYIDTIRMLVRNASELSLRTIVLCTGAKTHRSVKRLYPALPEEAFIRIADFIAETLEEVDRHLFEKVMIACMPGKLAKYSMGHRCTHAHKNPLMIELLGNDLVAIGVDRGKVEKLLASITVREVFEELSEQEKESFIRHMGEKSLENIREWFPKSCCSIHVFDYDCNLLTIVE